MDQMDHVIPGDQILGTSFRLTFCLWALLWDGRDCNSASAAGEGVPQAGPAVSPEQAEVEGSEPQVETAQSSESQTVSAQAEAQPHAASHETRATTCITRDHGGYPFLGLG